jgi:hypothetical protein
MLNCNISFSKKSWFSVLDTFPNFDYTIQSVALYRIFIMDVHHILYLFFLYGIPLAIAAALFGFRWNEGFYSNVLAAATVAFSALIAIGWWEDLASLLCGYIPKMLYLADITSVWIIFAVSIYVIYNASNLMSSVKVKFADPIEKAGNFLSLTLTFVLLYGFFLFTIDLGGVGAKKEETVANDSPQIQAARILSAGNLSSFVNSHQFDEKGQFRQLHLRRRQQIWDVVAETNGSFFYDGQIPPRRGK